MGPGLCAPPGTRTPNPLIIELIYSMLPYVARNPFISRVLVALWSFVATAGSLKLPVGSRTVRHAEPSGWSAVGPAIADAYVSARRAASLARMKAKTKQPIAKRAEGR